MNNLLAKNEASLPVTNVNGKNIQLNTGAILDMYHELVKNEEIQILPAATWLKYGKNNLAMFMNMFNIWVAPTLELIDILDDEIGDMSCIEICAGLGAIGRELGITTTDSHLHSTEEFKNTFGKMRGIAIDMKYPSDVEKLEASEAVDKYKPECVLGCYAVPKWTEKKATEYFLKYRKELKGSVVGVDYDYILPKVKKLILVGHDGLYSQHTFFNRKHRAVISKNIVTRHTVEGNSAIYIFNNN